MRTKENAHDYRYFPDPDLMPVKTDGLVATARAAMPELPAAKRARFVADYGVSPYDAAVLADDQELSAYFETAAKAGAAKPKNVANWVLNDLLSAVGSAGQEHGRLSVAARRPGGNGRSSSTQARSAASRARKCSRRCSPPAKRRRPSLRKRGWSNSATRARWKSLVDQVIAANPKPVADFKAGNPAPLNFLKGQVMKLSKGQANPVVTSEILQRKLSS